MKSIILSGILSVILVVFVLSTSANTAETEYYCIDSGCVAFQDTSNIVINFNAKYAEEEGKFVMGVMGSERLIYSRTLSDLNTPVKIKKIEYGSIVTHIKVYDISKRKHMYENGYVDGLVLSIPIKFHGEKLVPCKDISQ